MQWSGIGEFNLRGPDATLILPLFVGRLDLYATAREVEEFVEAHRVRTLNVAGRASRGWWLMPACVVRIEGRRVDSRSPWNSDRQSAAMPPKVKDLIGDLEQAGFVNRGGKGSHRNFVHPRVSKPVTISGALGDDALRYQIRAVRIAVKESEP